jgi:HlyD family secretion protein
MVILLIVALELRHSAPAWPAAAATREPFVEHLVETGTVSAERLMLYSSTIAGAQAKIVELVPEGQAVQAGDRLVRFDTSAFEQDRERERAALRQAQAELVRVRQDAQVEAIRTAETIDAAHQQIANAERGLANQVQGRGQVDLVEAQAAAAQADRDLDRARRTYADMEPLLDQGFITRAELDTARQALEHAEDQRRVAAARLDALVQYERPAATSRAQADLNSARDGLVRQQEASAAREAERAAAVAAARSRVDEIASRIAMLDGQIARGTIRAEGPGLVVYRDLFFGSDRRKPQVGDEVFPNQPIIALPDSSRLIVETRVREIDLHKVAESQRVVVRIDAYPDMRLGATVALVGALAQEDAARAGTRFFPVTVDLVDNDPRLRTGMTARVDIEVASIDSALVVPVQAIFDDHGRPYVVTLRDGEPVRRDVGVAAENDSMAALASGVAERETVLLVDPTAPRP